METIPNSSGFVLHFRPAPVSVEVSAGCVAHIGVNYTTNKNFIFASGGLDPESVAFSCNSSRSNQPCLLCVNFIQRGPCFLLALSHRRLLCTRFSRSMGQEFKAWCKENAFTW